LLTISVDSGGTVRNLNLLADKFSDLSPVLGPFSAFMRNEIQEVFDSQGHGAWAARKESSQTHLEARKASKIARIEATKFSGLENRLRSEYRRTIKRAEKPAKTEKIAAGRQRAIRRKEAQMAEVARLAAGGESQPRGQTALYRRVERRIVQSEKKIEAVKEGKLLGRIANSCKINYNKTSWEMESQVPWASVHNEGGTAGRGAKISERRFLEWTDARLEKFVEMAAAYLLGKEGKKAKA